MDIIRLRPVYQQRVWGGRELERLYGRTLPLDGLPYGESWEVVDRLEAQSIVDGGLFDGLSLHELWTEHRVSIFGERAPKVERFPLLLKILDARDDLSIQVHPPASIAAEMRGEPKSEMWYISDANPGASLAVGVQPGVTRESFEAALELGSAADCVHRLPVVAGDYIYIPSGRLHAIGGGLVIFEIQQNSDTTYRVFDWNRVGLDGKPRDLHVVESLRCIDFTDTQPVVSHAAEGVIVRCDYFTTEYRTAAANARIALGRKGEFSILALVQGAAHVGGRGIKPGDHCLVPANAGDAARELVADSDLIYLEIFLAHPSF